MLLRNDWPPTAAYASRGQLACRWLAVNTVQVTLVDCPGHASLIRTIIGGAQIIDMMLLVVDVTKGIQVCLNTMRLQHVAEIWYVRLGL